MKLGIVICVQFSYKFIKLYKTLQTRTINEFFYIFTLIKLNVI